MVLVLSLLIALVAQGTNAAVSREYKIKAAFLYNFIKFVDWPKEKIAGRNKPIIIGIVGKDPFGDAFEPVQSKSIKGRKVVIKRFTTFKRLNKSSEQNTDKTYRKIEMLKKCHLIFICPSEEKNIKEIINLVKDHSVLTVGQTDDFLKAGGIINFIVEDEKVRFEINTAAAKQAKLDIRSKLLRLAKKVHKGKSALQNTDLWRIQETHYAYSTRYDYKA